MSELPKRQPGTGKLEGYATWAGFDPHEDFAGPFYFKETDDGIKCAYLIESKHCNSGGSVHGGSLVTFADFSLFAISQHNLGDELSGVTVSLNSDFCGPARLGDLVEAEGTIIRETSSLIFVNGRAFVGDKSVLSFSGIIKKLLPRS